MPPSTPASRRPVRPTIGDHARVAWLLLCTLAGGVPFLVFIPLAPILVPWLKRRARKHLQQQPAALAEPPSVDVQACAGKTVFVVAGEASGDRLAARVIARAREACPDLRVRGYGGRALAAAGAELDKDIVSHAVFGFFGVVGSLRTWWQLCAETIARFREEPPDLLLTVDFPGLNVRLAGWARKRGIHTVHLVAPKLWAHTPWRILRWRKAVDTFLATFPFEPLLFEDSGIRTLFVGHPLFEAPLPAPRTAGEYPRGACTIELWPGSRRREITRHAGPLIEAAAEVERQARPDATFVVRLARPEHEAWFREHARTARWAPRGGVAYVVGEARYERPLLGAMAVSGTATAELAVDLVPLSVVYRIGLVDWLMAQVVVTAPWISVANLVLGRPALRERLCWVPHAGEHMAADFLASVGDAEAWHAVRADLAAVRARLETPHVATRTAGWVLAETAAGAQRNGAVAAPGQPASPAGGPS